MYYLGIIGFLTLFMHGWVPDGSRTSRPDSQENKVHYRGEIARSRHPLSNLNNPVYIPIQPLIPIGDPDLTGYLPENIIRRDPDILFTLPYLQSQYPEPVLNGPLISQPSIMYLERKPYPTSVTLSRERYFHLQLDNDIFNYTDRFYTNGIQVTLISPTLRQNPVSRLLIPYWNRGINYYGISLVQDMYTPSTTKIGGILYGDRPYAALLYIGSSKITNDEVNSVRVISEIQLGILGPASLGEYVQRTFHNAVPTNNEPLGWEYQVRNDLLLNYFARAEKGIVSVKGLDVLVHGYGSIGTVYTNIGGGTYIRAGWFNPYFSNLFFSKRSINRMRQARNVQFYLFAEFSGKAIGYDATLQGGMFNQTSPYTIPAGDINRLMFIGSGGIVFSFGGFQLKAEQFLLSPEFANGWWHKWLSIGLTFGF